MKKEIYPEIFERVEDSFQRHLDLSENHRIIFSGRFGIGKTTFIRKFFSENKMKYNCIHLFPLNYSVLENEDIFSYIKYDILTELFGCEDYPFKPDYYSFLKTWDSFMLDNIGQVIATTMLLIPKIGKQLNQFVKEIRQMAKDFKVYKKTKKDLEMDAISDILANFHDSEGGVYESNIITLIIQDWLRDIKTNGKENILIIDDLDRIDPSHIFRILNIFSAHFDKSNEIDKINKFGFDKIIIVCDIDNIKRIYSHQFGVNTDFNGYVDKFYSKEIYEFDVRDSIIRTLDRFLEDTNFGTDAGDTFRFWDHSNDKQFIIFILSELIRSNEINIRSLKKFEKTNVEINYHSLYINSRKVEPIANPVLFAIWFCSKILGNINIISEKIESVSHLNNQFRQLKSMSYLVANLAMLANTNKVNADVDSPFSQGNERYEIRGLILTYEVYPIPKFRNTYEAKLSGIFRESNKMKNLIDEVNFVDSTNWVELLRAAIKNLSD